MSKHVKWCFNVGKWIPSREDWLKLTSSISEEELTRINRFHYQEDSKSSIIGRTLIRKFVSLALDVPSNEVGLARTDLGRPVICQESLERLAGRAPRHIDFNVSHSGDYCVLAGFWIHEANPFEKLTVGVDVTKVVQKSSKQELDRFLELMSRREFLPDEWDTVVKPQDDKQKCINFTRLWCLKESFIKSIGLGLSFKLSRICFRPADRWRYELNPEQLKGNLLNDTKVLIDGQLSGRWTFLETALDGEHLVAIGYNHQSSPPAPSLDESPFVELDINSLIEGVASMRSIDDSNWVQFSSKATKTKSQTVL